MSPGKPIFAKDAFKDAVKAYENGEYEESVRIWTIHANKGNAVSEYNLAVCYENGHGVDQDINKAIELYRKSANKRHPDSQLNLGKILLAGIPGEERDVPSAIYWITEAARNEVAEAQYQLGKLLAEGVDMPKDLVTARYWLLEAEKQNHKQATSLLHNISQDFLSGASDSDWILQQNPDRYTVQISSFSNQEGAHAYIEENGLIDSAIIRNRYGWYLLVGGIFENYNDAHEAIMGLPDEIRDIPPQIRKISTIQKILYKEQ